MTEFRAAEIDTQSQYVQTTKHEATISSWDWPGGMRIALEKVRL